MSGSRHQGDTSAAFPSDASNRAPLPGLDKCDLRRMPPYFQRLVRLGSAGDDRAHKKAEQLAIAESAWRTVLRRLDGVRIQGAADEVCGYAPRHADGRYMLVTRDAWQWLPRRWSDRVGRWVYEDKPRSLGVLGSVMLHTPRRAVLAYEWSDHDETHTTLVDGRHIRRDWEADPQLTAARLAQCAAGFRTYVRADGTPGAAPYKCDSSVCPRCVHRNSQQRVREMLPIISGLVDEGYQVGLVTLTQAQRAEAEHSPFYNEYTEAVPVSLNTWERERYPAETPATDGWAGAPVRGESLRAAWNRWVQSFKGLRDSRRQGLTGQQARDWWRSTVAGYQYGTEATGRNPHTRELRWHVHGHVLVIWRPDVELQTRQVVGKGGKVRTVLSDVDPWRLELLDHWEHLSPGISVESQDIQVITDAASLDGRAVEDALQETLKYLAKPAELTRAQVLEMLASMKGRKPRNTGGVMHGSSDVGLVAHGLEAGDDTEVTIRKVTRTAEEWLDHWVERGRDNDADLARLLGDLYAKRSDDRVETYPIFRRCAEGEEGFTSPFAGWAPIQPWELEDAARKGWTLALACPDGLRLDRETGELIRGAGELTAEEMRARPSLTYLPTLAVDDGVGESDAMQLHIYPRDPLELLEALRTPPPCFVNPAEVSPAPPCSIPEAST